MKRKNILILLVLVLLVVLYGCREGVGKYTYGDSRRYTAGAGEIDGRVDAVDISWIDGSVRIACHNGDEVILREEADSRLSGDKELRWWLDGRTLRVKYAESGFRTSKGLDKELTVLLPEALLEELTVSVVSAEVEVEAVAADRLEIASVSGNVRADMRRASQVKADSVSGRVDMCFDMAPEVINVDSVSGDVTLALPRSSGFTAEVDSVSGSVRGDFPMENLGKGRYVGGNGECDIDVDTVSGSVRFDTAE